jgi:hypothetical protein
MCQLRAREINLVNAVCQAMSGQAKGIGPESIGLNDLRPTLQVLVVDASNQVRLREIQFVVAAIDEHALAV